MIVAPLAAMALVGGGALAYADNIVNNIDATVDPLRETVTLSSGQSQQVGIYVQTTDGDGKAGCNLQGNTASVVFDVASSSPAAVTVSPSRITIDNCGDTRTVTVTRVGTGSADITFTVSSNTSAGSWSGAPANFTVADGGTAQQPVNRAPVVVGSGAADATGDEGSALTTSGSFSDPDGDNLRITKLSGAGTVTPGATNGTWSWSHTPADNGSGTVVVQASDGELTVADSFDWTASNVAPTLVATLGGSNCQPTVSGSFTDPGSLDTHTGSIDWGDGSVADTFTASPFGPIGHSYAGAGVYPVTISVSDDDGGTDTESPSHTVYNTHTGIGQPINSNGTSVFKLGSTVPVKTSVSGCSGAVSLPAGSRPTITLKQISSNVDGSVNESVVSTSSADSGNELRETTVPGDYIYNLATKGLSVSTYRLTVDHPTFRNPIVVEFGLRK